VKLLLFSFILLESKNTKSNYDPFLRLKTINHKEYNTLL